MEREIGSVLPLRRRHEFMRAREAFCHDDMTTATALLDPIASALPDDVEVRLYAMWARTRLATTMTKRDYDVLVQLARDALGSRHSLALPLCILGHAALRRGELRVAGRLFRRAAEADPALIDARRGLVTVERRL